MLKLMTLIFTLILVLSVGLIAQTETREITNSSFKAMGAPNNPKVEIAWNRYYDWKEIGDICNRLAKAHPNLIKYGSIGKSVEDRDIHILTVTNFKKGTDD